MNKLVILGGVFLLLTSCSIKKRWVTKETDFITKDSWIKQVEKASIDFKFLQSKISTKIDIEKENGEKERFKLKTNLRMAKDSAIFTHISFSGIPVVQTLIRKDSFWMVYKREKTFSKNTIQNIGDKIGIDIELKLIQGLLLSNPVVIGEPATMNKWMSKDSSQIVVSTHSKESLEKIISDNEQELVMESNVFAYWFDRKTLKLKKQYCKLPKKDITITAEILEYQLLVDGQLFPKKETIKIQAPNKAINVKLEFMKVKLNKSQKLDIRIPAHYEYKP